MIHIVKQLREGLDVSIITPSRQKEVIQINKKEKTVCWERYTLPLNGDRSKAIKLNEKLNLKEVVSIVKNNARLLQSVKFD